MWVHYKLPFKSLYRIFDFKISKDPQVLKGIFRFISLARIGSDIFGKGSIVKFSYKMPDPYNVFHSDIFFISNAMLVG